MKICQVGVLTLVVLGVLSEAEQSEEEPVEKVDGEWAKFARGFKEKRLYQLTSAKQLLSKKPAQQEKAVEAAMTKIKAILIKNKLVLESAGVVSLEGKQLPQETKTREAVAFMLENTCFASDFVLRFPDMVHRLLATDSDLSSVLKWGLGFTENAASVEAGNDDLFDPGTQKLLQLAQMEMGIKEKSEDYQNKYAKEKSDSDRPKKKVGFVDPPAGPAVKKTRKKLPRGPKMSKTEL